MEFNQIVSGPYDPYTNTGGADDSTVVGGSDTHLHSFPHGHTPGDFAVLPSGAHPGEHQVDFNGNTKYVEVNPVAAGAGTRVSTYDHTHNLTIIGGNHVHPKENFAGTDQVLTGADANTQVASSLPAFREVLICIKKI